MALFTPARRVFGAVVDALGFTGDGALTKIDLEKAIPTFSTDASVEAAQVRYSEFILLRTDVGADDTTVDVDVHVLGDWTEIRNRGRTLVGIAGSEVPPEHDAWIIRAGVATTVGASFTTANIFTDSPTLGAGSGQVPLYFGDVIRIGRAGSLLSPSPYVQPPPWYVPPVAEQAGSVRFNLATTGATSTNLTLAVLSAPPGVLKRLY